MGGGRIQFNTVCVPEANHIAAKLHNGELHAKAESQEWNTVFAGILDGVYLAVNAPVTKSARHQDSFYIMKDLGGVGLRDML